MRASGRYPRAETAQRGGTYRAGTNRELRAEAELAVVAGADGTIAGYAAALELVDVGRPPSPEGEWRS